MRKVWLSIALIVVFGLGLFLFVQKYVAPEQLPVVTPDASNVPKGYLGKLSLFALVGQSNMSGRGTITEEVAGTNPRVFMFGNDYRWKLASEPIDDPTNQVDAVSIDYDAGVGPAMAFANTLTKHDPDIVVGLIPCARGSSSITDWQRNLSDASLYGSCLKRINAALPYGVIRGILFFQGETDAANPADYPDLQLSPNRWASLFSDYVSDIRADLSLPELPVVFAQIGKTTPPDAHLNWEVVKQQQASVNIPIVAMIKTDDLVLQDEVHFTTGSYLEIGRRLAEGYRYLLEAAK